MARTTDFFAFTVIGTINIRYIDICGMSFSAAMHKYKAQTNENKFCLKITEIIANWHLEMFLLTLTTFSNLVNTDIPMVRALLT